MVQWVTRSSWCWRDAVHILCICYKAGYYSRLQTPESSVLEYTGAVCAMLVNMPHHASTNASIGSKKVLQHYQRISSERASMDRCCYALDLVAFRKVITATYRKFPVSFVWMFVTSDCTCTEYQRACTSYPRHSSERSSPRTLSITGIILAVVVGVQKYTGGRIAG